MRLYNLLSFRLFILIFILLTILSIGFSLYYVTLESEQYEEIARQCAQRTSHVVAASTKNAMLLNNKESAYEIMRAISKQEGIDKICLFDKKGNIVFSTYSAEIGERVDVEYKACSQCHTNQGSLKVTPSGVWHDISADSTGTRVLNYITPLENEESCYTASCHAHPESKKYVGLLCVSMSLRKMDELAAENQARIMSTSIGITIILGLFVGVLLWIWVHIPVNKLTRGTREISSGNLDYTIQNGGKDEMGILARSFNQMTGDLREAKVEITSWSNQLEHRVKVKTEELEKTQKRNLQIEKMASLGQLSATVAHELNNPMAGILTYSKLIQKKLNKDHLSEEERQSILKHLKMIESESARSGDIVKNMLLFSRQEAIDIKPKQLDTIIDASLDLILHHLELHNIILEKDFQKGLPPVDLDENQMKQALLALYVNAVEAMEDGGTLTIKSRGKISDGYISIFVQDTGKGIPESVRSQIFEPFFTTKNEVKGVGLGLAAVYAIIQKHGGDITFETEMENGTSFEIRMPLKKGRTSKV